LPRVINKRSELEIRSLLAGTVVASKLLEHIVRNNEVIWNKCDIEYKILSYLLEHPSAQDTLEGIIEWWLLEQEIKCQAENVKEAIGKLMNKELILQQMAGDSRPHYRANQNKFAEIKRLLGN
jgi:hypothetical protein